MNFKRKTSPEEYSSVLRCADHTISYRAFQSTWSLPVSAIQLIAEFTNSDGPHIDGYFFVFMTAPEGGWYQASFYAKGRDEVLAALSARLGAPIECGLCNSTEYKTRIIWPAHLKDLPLMDVIPLPNPTWWQKFTGEKTLRLSVQCLDSLRGLLVDLYTEVPAGLHPAFRQLGEG